MTGQIKSTDNWTWREKCRKSYNFSCKFRTFNQFLWTKLLRILVRWVKIRPVAYSRYRCKVLILSSCCIRSLE